MIASRIRRHGAWGERFALILLFAAWFAQSGAAVLHERLMPQRGIADVFCGLASVETLRSFRANAPSELLAAIEQRRADSYRDEAHRNGLCALCVGVHAQLAAGHAASLWLPSLARDVWIPALASPAKTQAKTFAFHARGPPFFR